MRDDICTIPVSEVFETNDGCPICRMISTVENRIIDYIMGDAMMEPDVRIETNKVGFCEEHLNKMLSRRGRLQLALMLQTHIDEINNTVFADSIFNSAAKKGEKAAKLHDSCFICNKIEFGVSRMIETIYRCYENEKDFREMFNNQEAFCLPHFERLIKGTDKHKMKRYGGDFSKNLTRITSEYSKKLYDNVSEYCKIYDYRSANGEKKSDEIMYSVEKVVEFLNGKI
ncbi:MAG: hypothetical protein E7560_00910 [Ruminococcaceae bacterium]|nr:hypothetical protein [Oscillospiraceae bacterium]